MTKEEKLIVSAYTGVLMVEWEEFLDFIERKLGRPVLAKETESEEFAEEIINSVKDEFMQLCEE